MQRDRFIGVPLKGSIRVVGPRSGSKGLEGLGFRASGCKSFRVWGFRVLGFRALGFQGLGL